MKPIAHAIAEFLAARAQPGGSRHTAIAYAQDLGKLARFAEERALATVCAIDALSLRQFLAQLHQTGLGAKSLTRLSSTLRSFFEHTRRLGWRHDNPATDLRAPKVRRRLPDVLDADETAALLEIDARDPLSTRDRAALELFYSSGLRLAELAALKWEDLDFPDATVRVLGKGAKLRVVPVGSHALMALEAWRDEARGWRGFESGYVFLNGRGGCLSHRAIQLRIKTWAQRQGIWKRVHPHLLRHSFASHLLESSGNLRAVQELLGHANLATTQIYTHVDFMQLARVYDQAHPRARGIKSGVE